MMKGKARNFNVYETHSSTYAFSACPSHMPTEDKISEMTEYVSTVRVGSARATSLNAIAQLSKRLTAADRLKKKLAERKQNA